MEVTGVQKETPLDEKEKFKNTPYGRLIPNVFKLFNLTNITINQSKKL